ncbi:IS30 family transposase [Comamonas sp. NLF-1-9]|uniref:IS30 family transposase n=1 Tax=Comamonas sp. NLF-1-9 TaxID=2853163 RepID=UPI001C487789|nr:IS30 family transposase [Comamonas sp. NLF-1-9]QXL83200.1 IS30 family transposase [Comamonas sp. NLF-1-9]
MGKRYEHLTAEERATIMLMLSEGHSRRRIAHVLHRSPSTISREVSRCASWQPGTAAASAGPHSYDAHTAGSRARVLRSKKRKNAKLHPQSVLFGIVQHFLLEHWSPRQIAGTLKRVWPNDAERTMSHESIYNCIYAMAKGELRRELIACLRRAQSKRMPRSRGADHREQLPDALSIQVRAPEANDLAFPGHREGDLIKGAGNRAAVGVLVERSSRLVMLAKMKDATAASALQAFTDKLQSIAEPMRKTLTYDQGKEMARHGELTQATGVKVYFCDPHSPWQRGSCENINGLIRQYLPKGTDLSAYSQDELDAIADQLNSRPRAVHGFYTPMAVYRAMLDKIHQPSISIH